jgi:hypothetical protein
MIDLLQALPGVAAGKGGKSEEHITAAQNIWKALDDMAEADPEQYNKFIRQQMEQAQQLGLKKPTNHPSVILTASIERTECAAATAAVISLFESEECQQPSVSGKTWNASSVQLSEMRAEFRVCQLSSCTLIIHLQLLATSHRLMHPCSTGQERPFHRQGSRWRSMCL